MISALAICLLVLLVWFNGANDTGKGVATLTCAGELSSRRALALGVLATLFGALCALLWGHALLARFSGNGLVPDEVAAAPEFLLAAGLGALATVALATGLRYPISTSHALLGGLLGAGLQAGQELNEAALMGKFLLPLLFSPLAAFLLAWAAGRWRLGGGRSTHVMAGGAVSFARGFNDAPKIAAIALLVPALHGPAGLLLVAMAMAGGGWFAGRTLARRVSTDLCDCTPAQGCGANWVSAALVIAHTPLGLPVSTTHVTLGAVAGAGTAGARLDRSLFGGFLLAWVVTLPCAALLALGASHLLEGRF